jgi:serine/threonine-protein kinase/endoribonuclease IRE1
LVSEDSHGINSEKTLEKETDSTISITSTVSIPTTNAASLQKIQVTDNILGYGSHGTVVLEGKFEGRKVAVKRMLAEF